MPGTPIRTADPASIGLLGETPPDLAPATPTPAAEDEPDQPPRPAEPTSQEADPADDLVATVMAGIDADLLAARDRVGGGAPAVGGDAAGLDASGLASSRDVGAGLDDPRPTPASSAVPADDLFASDADQLQDLLNLAGLDEAPGESAPLEAGGVGDQTESFSVTSEAGDSASPATTTGLAYGEDARLAGGDEPAERGGPEARRRLADRYGKVPLVFERNMGQAGLDVRYLSRGPGATALFTERGVTLRLAETAGAPASRRIDEVSLSFVGANDAINILGADRLPTG